MITINKPHFKCEYCKKNYFRSHACLKHEDLCDSNPKNLKSCFKGEWGCKHLEQINIVYTAEIRDFESDEGDTYEVNKNGRCFNCKLLNKKMYPWKIEKKNYPFQIGNCDQSPMPKECDSFEATNYDINF